MRFLALILMITTLALADTKKAVFALTTPDIEKIENRLIGGIKGATKYYKNQNQQLESIVVIHGEAYKFFVKDITKTAIETESMMDIDTDELHAKISDFIKTHNVSLYICSVGMKRNGIEESNILNNIKVIPSAMIELIELQNSGYAYIPIE